MLIGLSGWWCKETMEGFVRKLACVAVAGVLLLSMASCGDDDKVNAGAATTAASAAPGGASGGVVTQLPTVAASSDCTPKATVGVSKGGVVVGNVIQVTQGQSGIELNVRVTCIGAGDAVWAFDQNAAPNTDDPAFYMDDDNSGSHGPIAYGKAGARTISFTYYNRPVGSPGDQDEPYRLYLVADKNGQCNQALTAVKQNEDHDYVIPNDRGSELSALLPGCKVVFTVNLNVVKY